MPSRRRPALATRLFLAPATANGGIASAPAVSDRSVGDLVTRGNADGWPRYFGAPRSATPTIGEAALRQPLDAITAAATTVLDRKPWNAERFDTEPNMDPASIQISRVSAVRDAELRARQQARLRTKGVERA